MKIKEIVEKIEGEAELDFKLNNGVVEDVQISFGFYRGIEDILIGKAPLDSLVITPRVCGICNHSHLIAAAKAIEDGYKSSGIEFKLTQKAELIRDFTLSCELIQNHFKWFYMTMIPYFYELKSIEIKQNYPLKALYPSQIITKAMSIFSGQWPHSSYAVPGGVTCDPTYVDILQSASFIDEVIDFFQKVVIGIDLEEFLSIENALDLEKVQGDLGEFLYLLGSNDYAKKGQSHDRFIVFGSNCGFKSGKSIATTFANVDINYVKEFKQKRSKSKGVEYKEKFFETGPLSRAMVAKVPIIKSLHKRYKDSVLIRVFARVREIAQLLHSCKKYLDLINPNEESCTLKASLLSQNFEGVAAVEAARGSLIHKTKVEDGKISKYEIITPTQWNLSNSTKEQEGVAIKAMRGSSSTKEATFIFRSFDICSVCTVQ